MTANFKLQMHPNAIDRLTDLSIDLAGRIKKYKVGKQDTRFDSELPIASVITPDQIKAEIEIGEKDSYGEWTARFFVFNDDTFGIAGPDYDFLRSMVDLVLKDKTVKSHISREFIEDAVFSWCRSFFRKEYDASIYDFLLGEFEKAVQPHRAIVPISFLEVARPIRAGNSTIQPISKAFIDDLEEEAVSNAAGTQVNEILKLFGKFRHKMQGHASVQATIVGESQFAYQQILHRSTEAIAMLRLYSEAAYIARDFCPCDIQGLQYVPQTSAVLLGSEGSFGWQEKTSRARFWQITDEEAGHIEQSGWRFIEGLLRDDCLSEFQQKLKVCLLSYSKSLCDPDQGERLVGIISSIEGILLKNNSEPIQQNLGERIAFTIKNDGNERIQVVDNVKEVYRIRSEYVHHRVASFEDEAAIQVFHENAREFLYFAIVSSAECKTKMQFISRIDEAKFGKG